MFEKGHLKLLFRWNQLKWWCKNYNFIWEHQISLMKYVQYQSRPMERHIYLKVNFVHWPALASILLSGYISYFFHLTNWLIDNKEQVKVTKSLLMNISTLDKRNTQIDFNIYTLYIGIWAWHHHDYLVQSVIFLRLF